MPTKFQLITALLSGGPLTTPKGSIRIVQRVEREDGSGHCFNVTGTGPDNKSVTLFVRTVD